MPGSFTLGGKVQQVTKDGADGGIDQDIAVATGWTALLTSNYPKGVPLPDGSDIDYITTRTITLLSDGSITEDGVTAGISLTAHDPAVFATPFQWTIQPGTVTFTDGRTMRPKAWTFNAPLAGVSKTLGELTPVVGMPLQPAPDSVPWGSVTGKPDFPTGEWEPFANLAAFPNPGVSTKEYLAIDTGLIYRWAGSGGVGPGSGYVGAGGGDLAATTHAASSKTTPVDADEIPLADSALAFGLKKLPLANLKTFIGFTSTLKTSAYTAAVGDLVVCDAGSTSAFTVTLPTAPADNSRVAIKKIDTNRTRAITVTRGGSTDVFNKAGGSTSLTLQLPNQAMVLQYNAAGGIWYVVSTDVPLGETDVRYQLFLNPMSYGALGNGTTDDTTAVQACVDAAAAANMFVFIPKAVLVSSKVVLKQGMAGIIGGGRGSIIRAKSGTTGIDFGVIEMAQGQIDSISLANFQIQGNGNAGQWGIYLVADKGAGSTGGLYESDFTGLNIGLVDNGIWLRGGQTGSLEPHQFLNFDNVTVSRTAAGAGDNYRATGQVNQVNYNNFLLQSASVSTTRTGRCMVFGRDPVQVTAANTTTARYPQGHHGNIVSVQGALWALDIDGVQNLTFDTLYCEQLMNGIRARSLSISNPTDVTVNNPRFANVASNTDSANAAINANGGQIVDYGDYCDVRINPPGYFTGTMTTPYICQGDSVTGGSSGANLEINGFNITNASTTLFDGPVPVKTMTNAGTASIASVGACKAICFRGRGAGAASLGTLNSLLGVGQPLFFTVTSVALDVNNTGNITLPGGASLWQMAVGDQGRFTKFYDGTSYKWRLEQIGYAATSGAASTAATLATPRNINGVSFNGSANITVPSVVKRVVSPAVAGTYTIDITATDVYVIGTQTSAITNITTTGTIADTLTPIMVRIKGDATPRAITWDSTKILTTASAPLPSTTVASKTILVGLMPDAVLGKMVCVAVDAAGY